MKTNKKSPPKLNKNTKNSSENSKVKGKSQLYGISETNESSQIALKAPDVKDLTILAFFNGINRLLICIFFCRKRVGWPCIASTGSVSGKTYGGSFRKNNNPTGGLPNPHPQPGHSRTPWQLKRPSPFLISWTIRKVLDNFNSDRVGSLLLIEILTQCFFDTLYSYRKANK